MYRYSPFLFSEPEFYIDFPFDAADPLLQSFSRDVSMHDVITDESSLDIVVVKDVVAVQNETCENDGISSLVTDNFIPEQTMPCQDVAEQIKKEQEIKEHASEMKQDNDKIPENIKDGGARLDALLPPVDTSLSQGMWYIPVSDCQCLDLVY